MPCSLFAPNLFNFQEITQNIKLFGVPPNTLTIGNVHSDILPFDIITLKKTLFKTIAGRFIRVF